MARRNKAIAKVVWREKIDTKKLIEALALIAVREQQRKADRARRPEAREGGAA